MGAREIIGAKQILHIELGFDALHQLVISRRVDPRVSGQPDLIADRRKGLRPGNHPEAESKFVGDIVAAPHRKGVARDQWDLAPLGRGRRGLIDLGILPRIARRYLPAVVEAAFQSKLETPATLRSG